MAASSILRRRCISGVLRGQTFFYFSLGCYAMFGTYGFPADPHSEPRRHCRESFSLDQWNQVWLHQHSPELPEPREVLHSLYHLYLLRPLQLPRSPYQRQHRLMPPTVPPTSEPPITIPGAEYRALLASFQTLTTTQTAIMERMDHFQLRQDQQTLILREIQQHLGLLPPAPPVASPLLSGGITSSLLLSLAFGTLGTMFILVGGS
ncbi:hypothetical protein CK203_006553 [Vitis vinifera]|uniref:Uncharacterized protein n=1 Tax=Vitis vinifera TaxID=29760 RepID=A0A438KBF5_VITVI|nr:hypothetical protein CK203_006553 [Vitis vinifera]